MKRIGQFLIELGWITQDDLSRALQSQEVLGGRLGTCLLEMEALSEEQLTKALSHQLGVEAIRARDLRNIPPEVHRLLPSKVALRVQAIPFRMLGGQIYVAMLDVHNLALHDEIAFATGKAVRVHIAHEVRLFEALTNYYGFDTPARYQQLLTRLNDNGTAAAAHERGDEDAPPNSDVIAVTARLPNPLPLPLANSDELARPDAELEPVSPPPADDDFDTHGVSSSTGRSADVEGTGVIDQSRVSDHNDIAAQVLAHLAEEFDTVSLFKVKKEAVQGWMGHGPHLDEGRLRGLRVGFDGPSVFLNLREGGLFFAGPLPAMIKHLDVAKCWGGELPRQCLVLPVRIGERLVAAIVCDPGRRGLAEIDFDHMVRLAGEMGAALGNCIVRNKRSRN